MVGSIATSPAVDLSALPPPEVIPQPDFETRLADKLARLIVEHPDFDALVESDPAMKLLEADSYDETVLTQAFAEAARGLLLAFANGPRLEHLAALYGVVRLEDEDDAAMRQRVQLAPHSFSVAGPELAYVYHARSAHPDVADATAISPTPGQVVVTVLSLSGDGVPSSEVLSAVETALDNDVRPLTDEVLVEPASLVDFTVEANLWVFAGPDQELIRQTAQAALEAHLASARKLGRDVNRSALIAALHVGNVERVELVSPAANVVIGSGEIGRATAIDVAIAGTVL